MSILQPSLRIYKSKIGLLLGLLFLLVGAVNGQGRRIYYAYSDGESLNDPAWELLVLWDDSLYYWECSVPNLDHSTGEVSAGAWRLSGDNLALASFLKDSVAAARCRLLATQVPLPNLPETLFGRWDFWYAAGSQVVARQMKNYGYWEGYHSAKPEKWIFQRNRVIRFDPEYGTKVVLKRMKRAREIPQTLRAAGGMSGCLLGQISG